MSLLALREAAVLGIAARLQPVKVQPHPGRFDLSELDRYATGAPAVMVAITSVANVSDDVSLIAECQMAAYIITRADPEYRADERALVIASAILATVDAATWGLDGAHAARELRWQNLYGTEDVKRGAHLSAVTWRQPYQLSSNVEGLPDFALLVAKYDLGPDPDEQIEAEDQIALETETP